MKTYLDCYVCLMRQALTATRQAGLDDDGQSDVVHHVLSALLEIAPGMTIAPVCAQVPRNCSRDLIAPMRPEATPKSAMGLPFRSEG